MSLMQRPRNRFLEFSMSVLVQIPLLSLEKGSLRGSVPMKCRDAVRLKSFSSKAIPHRRAASRFHGETRSTTASETC